MYNKMGIVSVVDTYIMLIFPIILLLVVIKIMLDYLLSSIKFSLWTKWWEDNNGKPYKNFLDLTSVGLFNYSKLTFNLQQLYVSGPDQINETSIMLLQALVLNKIKIDDHSTPSNFTLPAHVCKSIAWGVDDIEAADFCGAVIDFYTASTGSGAGNTWWTSTGSGLAKKNLASGDPNWVGKQSTQTGGFWPHQNGCSGFFDTPGGSGTPYDLIENLPPLRTKVEDPIGYVPGGLGGTGSWAQLFADWGIIYTTNTKEGQTRVPIPSDGAKCWDKDSRKGIQPCPARCIDGKAGSSDMCKDDPKSGAAGNYPTSDMGFWYKTGMSQDGTKIGLNFVATNFINPQSFILTSWVGDLYDDPTTGIIFDAQAFRNLIGYTPPSASLQIEASGGWIRFFKGLNTNITSFDNVINELFRQYATQFTAYPTKPRSAAGCSPTDKGKAWAGGAGGGAIGGAAIGAPFFPPAGLIVGACVGAFLGGSLSATAACGNPF